MQYKRGNTTLFAFHDRHFSFSDRTIYILSARIALNKQKMNVIKRQPFLIVDEY